MVSHKRIQRARSRLVSALARKPVSGPCPAAGCEAARAYAHALLDGSLGDSDRAMVSAHLDACPCCPAAVQAAAGVLEALARREREEPIPAPIRARLERLISSK